MNKLVKEVFDWVKSILIAVIVIFLISTFITQHYAVNGESMEPTLEGNEPNQDRVLINKLAKPDYGDIVIVDSRLERERSLKDEIIDNPLVKLFNDNSTETSFWIKRVIGLPGDLIESRNGSIYRNGEKLEESFILEEMTISFEPVVVPKDAIYLMGDNRNNSLDSTEVGPFPISNIIGEVYIRFYPFSRFGLF
ncbi:signal peptidase I [Bacillus luteolus]|uniref:Signal peptidase I n=1 Tax=Litchfieldia luteola TaxID=682179 RepID=A0ABR9QFC5_9BACI|nr:signal peptidase I [Cytobacillus luteolus]MBE4907185.1 signal peptidase I [Cytobacillus luteolus]MBP1943344.1 signal peptidase I [Cytobacillus luteolus]